MIRLLADRVGDYRLIGEIQGRIILLLVLMVGHRGTAYDRS